MVAHRIVLKFPHRLVEQPIVSKLVKEYDLELNILKANVTPREEGLMVLELTGESDSYDGGVAYLEGLGITVQALSSDIKRNEDRCTHCGACVAVCPSGALALNPDTRMIDFDSEKCVACELCVPACPPRAMELHF
jgi:ferredoxin